MLQKIIHQLNEKDYSLFSLQLRESKADKYLLLLNNYRKEKSATDKELIERLNVKPPTFYTLKSRLSDKVQFFLYKNASETRIELIQNVAKIEHLVFNTPRETSIQILKKLETELIKNDMPNELITVYKALKKLHLHSQKHFDYSRLYNKYVAYNLAQDKAEDLLSSFCKTLGEYYLSRNEQEFNKLILFKKEMENVCRLYQSHRLKIYKNILNIHFALFLPADVKVTENATIESMLSESLAILEDFDEDKVYKHLIHVINFLNFEYYHQLKLYKNADIYYAKIAEKREILLLFHHSCFASHFLISKIEYEVINSKQSDFNSENDVLDEDSDPEHITNYILLYIHKAAVAFYEEYYSDAIQKLNKLLQEISFKNITFSEVETKLFLAMLYIFNKDKEQATIILRNVTRKIKEEKDHEKYFCALEFIKLLKSFGKEGIKRNEKRQLLHRQFKAINIGRYKILDFLVLSEKMLLKIK